MTATALKQTVTTGPWQLDPVHSTVGFAIPYLTGTFRGEFRDVDATLTFGGEDVRVRGSARVASVDVKDENLAAHLQSPDFFDAERHPELRFESHDLELLDGGVTVRGELTMKGITRPIELTGTLSDPLVDGFGRERIGLKLTTTVDRTDFGIDWNMQLPNGEPALPNDVTLSADLYFTRA